MERKVPVNIAQALQGAAAGVMVTNQDGAPGSKSAHPYPWYRYH